MSGIGFCPFLSLSSGSFGAIRRWRWPPHGGFVWCGNKMMEVTVTARRLPQMWRQITSANCSWAPATATLLLCGTVATTRSELKAVGLSEGANGGCNYQKLDQYQEAGAIIKREVELPLPSTCMSEQPHRGGAGAIIPAASLRQPITVQFSKCKVARISPQGRVLHSLSWAGTGQGHWKSPMASGDLVVGEGMNQAVNRCRMLGRAMLKCKVNVAKQTCGACPSFRGT